jgi:hypothetical protein
MTAAFKMNAGFGMRSKSSPTVVSGLLMIVYVTWGQAVDEWLGRVWPALKGSVHLIGSKHIFGDESGAVGFREALIPAKVALAAQGVIE